MIVAILNVVSGSIRFMKIFAGFTGEGASLSSKHFTYMSTRQLSRDMTVNDLGHISRSLDRFTSNFS